MQKLTGKYLFFKTVIHLLFLLMTLVFSIPAFYLFKSGDNSVSLTVRCVSSLSFVVLALFWHYVIRRSNLSKISKGAYLAGELLPITFCISLPEALFRRSRNGTPISFSPFPPVPISQTICS